MNYTDADVRTCVDWLYSAMHDDRQIPDMAVNLLDDLIPAITARAKAEALREFAADWTAWVASDAPQIRGGAAYRARRRADEIEAQS